MKEIKLTKGKVALVDDADYDLLNQLNWYAFWNGKTFYAARNSPKKRGVTIFMHQMILGVKGGDHINGNGLDNQRANLRACTVSQNGMNAQPRLGCASKYKGVTLKKKLKKYPWQAGIVVNKKRIHLGYFETDTEAAIAYNEKAFELFGEFARPNVI